MSDELAMGRHIEDLEEQISALTAERDAHIKRAEAIGAQRDGLLLQVDRLAALLLPSDSLASRLRKAEDERNGMASALLRREQDFETMRESATAAQQIAKECLDERDRLTAEVADHKRFFIAEATEHTQTIKQRDDFEAERDQLREALEAVEWAALVRQGTMSGCWKCRQPKSEGHAPDCIVGKALKSNTDKEIPK